MARDNREGFFLLSQGGGGFFKMTMRLEPRSERPESRGDSGVGVKSGGPAGGRTLLDKRDSEISIRELGADRHGEVAEAPSGGPVGHGTMRREGKRV